MGGWANNAPIVTDGLIFCVDAGNAKSYPGSGTDCVDIVGPEDGVLTNGVGYSSDNGGSFVFDGTDDYIYIDDVPQIDNPLTICAFVNADTVPASTSETLVIYGPTANGQDNWFGITSASRLEIFFTEAADLNNSSLRSTSNTLTCDGTTWHYVACTIDGATVKIYIDGAESKSTTAAFTIAGWYGGSDAVSIGRRGTTTTRYFDGKIALVQGYNRALSEAEILQNYNALKSRFE